MRDFGMSAHSNAGAKVLQRQRVSKRVKAKTARPSPLIPGLCVLLVVSIFFYVWTRVQVVQYGYEISSALREKEATITAHNEWTLELATLRSAQQVEERARTTLGMNPPRKDQLVIVR